MLNFEPYVGRHGEVSAQATVERFERHVTLRHIVHAPLKDLWHVLMDSARLAQRRAA